MAEEGFKEEAAPPLVVMPTNAKSWRLKIGKDGRVVIPAEARAQMNLDVNGHIVATLEGGSLRLDAFGSGLQYIRDVFAKYKKPGVSLVDEFIAEKRAEQRREDEEGV